MYKKLFKLLVIISLLFFANKSVHAQEKTVNVHLFWALGCPHCEHEKEFLDEWTQEDPSIKVYLYEISQNQANAKLLAKVGNALSANASGVPFTVIGNRYFSGFSTDENFKNSIKELAAQAKEENWLDVVTGLKNINKPPSSNPNTTTTNPTPKTVKLPLVGDIAIENLSLPTLTFVLALADGFNPCAMWVLLFLISLLLGMRDRKKMWFLGGTFIFASGLVYFLILAAWLNLFLFLSFIPWIRTIIGTVALWVGYKYLKEYRTNKDGGCRVVGGNENRKKVFEKLRELVAEKNFFISLAGITLLAFAVNIVEFVCSAGLPAVYTNILSQSNLPVLKYYLYLVFYIIVFMFDDFTVFAIAMITLKATGIENKYARFSHLVGGLIMLGIGLLMLFKPELLMFG